MARPRSLGQRDRLMREAGAKCAMCGAPFPLVKAHIAPRDGRETDRDDNLIMLCAPCESTHHEGGITRRRLLARKRALRAAPGGSEWPIGQAFSFELGTNEFVGGDVLLGVDDHPVIWRQGVATGLCAEFRDRRDRPMVSIRDGVLESGHILAQRREPLGDQSWSFWVKAARERGTGERRTVHLSVVVEPDKVRVLEARFWVAGYPIYVTQGWIAGHHNCRYEASHRPCLWLYTPDYRGEWSNALLNLRLPKEPKWFVPHVTGEARP